MDATAVAQRTELQATKEKFLQLLATDRSSAEFERLYTEVDTALTQLVHADPARTDYARTDAEATGETT